MMRYFLVLLISCIWITTTNAAESTISPAQLRLIVDELMPANAATTPDKMRQRALGLIITDRQQQAKRLWRRSRPRSFRPNVQRRISSRIRRRHPDLVMLILMTESMDDDERIYWFDILPSMTQNQKDRLREILVKEVRRLTLLEYRYANEIRNLNQRHQDEYSRRRKEARDLWNAGNKTQALAIITQQIESFPDDVAAYHQRSHYLADLKRYAEAITDLRRVTELEPNNGDAWGNLGWYLILNGEFASAQKASFKALEIEPTTMAWTVNLGHTYLLQGQPAIAQTIYQNAIFLIKNEKELQDGPLADFDIFIANGWQVEASRNKRAWFQEAFKKFKNPQSAETPVSPPSPKKAVSPSPEQPISSPNSTKYSLRMPTSQPEVPYDFNATLQIFTDRQSCETNSNKLLITPGPVYTYAVLKRAASHIGSILSPTNYARVIESATNNPLSLCTPAQFTKDNQYIQFILKEYLGN